MKGYKLYKMKKVERGKQGEGNRRTSVECKKEVKKKDEEYVLVTSKITHLDLKIEGKQDDIRTMLNNQNVELDQMTNKKIEPGEKEQEWRSELDSH